MSLRLITLDHGTEFMSRALEEWAFAPRPCARFHSTRETRGERVQTSGRITTDSAYPRLPFSIYFIELSGNDGWTARINQPYDGPSLALPRDASLMYPPPLFFSPTSLLHNGAVYNESIWVPVSQEEKDQCDDAGGEIDCSFGDGTKGFFWSFAVRKTSSPTAVPDGGSTALMLGFGALGVAVMSRRRAVVSVNGRRP